VVVDSSLEPVVVNPSAELMFAASPIHRETVNDILRRNEWLARMVESCLQLGNELSDPDTTLANGSRDLPVRADVSPLTGSDGKVHGAIIILHDLSHQKSAFDSGADRSDLNLRLSTAGLAHEVKNPLTGIKGAAELIAAMYKGEQRAQQYCTVILDGVNRIASLVEQALAASGPLRLAMSRVNIHQVLHNAAGLAGLYPTPPANITVIQDFDPSLPDVIGDTEALTRVFLNLLKNALEAIEPAGVIRLHTRIETEFRLSSAGKRRQFLRVEVSDSGPGLSDDMLAQLFTPFFTTKPAGTGLGLVLSQRIVAHHGGRLSAIRRGVPADLGGSPTSAGMTFRVILPLADLDDA
jgi:two-component system nitrogen regulation sensor histidine kinase GlnL